MSEGSCDRIVDSPIVPTADAPAGADSAEPSPVVDSPIEACPHAGPPSGAVPGESSPRGLGGIGLALPPVQQAAMSALAKGQTIRDAARSAGINRHTLGRWLRCDPGFRAAYNAWRQELIDSTRTRLLHTATVAAGAVHKAIENGDGRLALALLDRLGLASPVSAAPPAALDADQVLDEIALESEERRDALKRRLKASGQVTVYSSDERRLADLRREAAERIAQEGGQSEAAREPSRATPTSEPRPDGIPK